MRCGAIAAGGAQGSPADQQLGRQPCPPAPRLPRRPQALNEAARAVARKERERLKQQDRIRREQLEQMRTQQNADASKGEVRPSGC